MSFRVGYGEEKDTFVMLVQEEGASINKSAFFYFLNNKHKSFKSVDL
jgi:hypothetical protein